MSEEVHATGTNLNGTENPAPVEPFHVLYMEDDEALARLLQRRLVRSGYVVDIARDGREGMLMVRQSSYDVLLVDNNMPEYGGLEVIRDLAAMVDPPPAIMLTGCGNEKIAAQAIKVGATDYIVKDVDMGYLELLPVVLDQALQKQQLLKEKRKAEEERERLIVELQEALNRVKLLRGLVPICASCKSIRDDNGYWKAVEAYVEEHSDASFSHGICPPCFAKLYPDFLD